MEVHSPNHWTAREVPTYYFIEWLFSLLECKLQGEAAGFLFNLFVAGSPPTKTRVKHTALASDLLVERRGAHVGKGLSLLLL